MKKRMYQSPEIDFKFFLTSDILLASLDVDAPDGDGGDDEAIDGGYGGYDD